MACLLVVAAFALSACASARPLAEAESALPVFSSGAPGAGAGRLPPGDYYVVQRPDRNELSYFTLSAPRARFVGKATVDTGACYTTTFPGNVAVDRQGRIDIFPPCPGGAGFMQIAAGVLGRVRPLRTIVTPFPSTASLLGDTDSTGEVALGSPFDAATGRSSDEILLYNPTASGQAKPRYRLRVFTRNCTDPGLRKGPAHYPGSPAEIAFDESHQIVAQIGPMGGEACGDEYVERFAVGGTTFSSWLVPGRLAEGGHREPISFTPGAYTIARGGTIAFGAYVGKVNEGRAGGITYSNVASGFQPPPSRVFTDASGGLGGKRPQGTVAIGVDHLGNMFLQSQAGGYVIVEFPPQGSGNLKPLQTIRLPRDAVGWPGTFVEIRR